jgi:hypothetical protein
MKTELRRRFLRTTIKLVPAMLLAPIALRAAQAAGTCTDDDSESLRASLHYQAVADDAEKDCSKCGFFAPGEPKGCGECQIMSGPVDATGYCDSWSEKS